jgi:hypothetical protein
VQHPGERKRAADTDNDADDSGPQSLKNDGAQHRTGISAQRYTNADFFRIQNWGNLNATFTFPGTQDFNRADPRTYPERFSIRVPGPQNYLLKAHFVSWFVQDKWKLSRRATLSLGLRHDVEIVPLRETDNPQFSDPKKYPIDKNNYSPRVGLSYSLGNSSRTVLRAGYGMFFQRTPLTFLTPLIGNAVFADSFTATSPPNNADPGPSQGRLPTDPFLASGPTVNRTLLNSMFPPGSLQRNAGAVRLDNPDRKLSKSNQVSAGIERQFGNDMSVSADYIHSANRDQLMLKDLNPGLRRTTARTATIDRINPNFVREVLQSVNVGWVDYDSLQLQVDKRFSRGYAFRFGYTLSKGFGNTSQGQNDQIDTQLLGDLRLNLMEGPTTIDRRHNVVISGTYEVPHAGGLRFSSVTHALSGTPFSITDDTTDPDRNGLVGNDWLPAGTYSGNGRDAITVDYKGGRGGAKGPGFLQVDLRAGYKFKVGERKTLDVFTEVLNVTNHSSFANPNGNRRNANFLIVTALRGNGPTRTAQFGVRYGF